jgi:polyisoprenyl-phosphate glycosyltransferase
MTYKEKNFLSAVVYINNDEAGVKPFLLQLMDVLDVHFEKYEIVCVNDASTDQSASIVREIARAKGEGILTLINMSYHQGLEASMNAGVDLAIGDFVFEFDSITLDYEPGLIMAVYRHSLEGFDIVAASGKRKRLTSAIFYSIFNRNAHLQYELQTETFRILSRRAINRIFSMSATIPYRKALYANCGLKMDTLIYQPLMIKGIKKPDLQARYDTAFDALILFTNVAYKIAILLALVMMTATMAGGVYTIIIYALGIPVAGYTTTMLVMTAAFFGVFGLLAVMLKYLSVIVRLVFKEQKYIVESVEKISK